MAFVVLEIISLCVRLFMAKHLTGMKMNEYYRNVIFPSFVIILIPTSFALMIHFIMDSSLIRLIIVTLTYGLSFVALMFRFALEENQRDAICLKFKQLINKRK